MMTEVLVKMDVDVALDLLAERLKFWNKDEDEVKLYLDMYERYLKSGVFSQMEFDVKYIVDNDVVNYCQIISEGDEDFEKLVKVYKKRGLGDVSSESFDYYRIGFIEAVDDEENPTMFLVRF